MKVLLMVDTVRPPLTGVGRYAYELAQHLADDPGVDDLLLYDWTSGLMSIDSLDERIAGRPPAALASNVRRAARAYRQILSRRRIFQRLPILGGRLAGALRGDGFVAHDPAFALPPGNAKKVVTIPDLSVVKYPNLHPPLRVSKTVRDMQDSVRNAHHLITFSEFTRQELVDDMGYPADKITAVPLAAAAAFRPRLAEEVLPVLGRYGLTWRGYCLSVGTIEPRKRIDLLIDAFSRLPAELKQRFPLLLIGDRGWLSEELHTKIASLQARGEVRYLGYVPQDDLPQIYSAAAVCLYTSMYEGFGLPAVEAMASGTPLIASNASSLPEVCKDGALLIESGDIAGIAQALNTVLVDRDLARTLAERGSRVASHYSWQLTARKTVDVYRGASEY